MAFQQAHARDWEVEEVSQWISSLNLKGPNASEIPKLFETHEIDGEALFTDIDEEALTTFGITYLQRKKVLRSLENLMASVEERESWSVNSPVQVYSNKNEKWCDAKIIRVFVDSEGEWLEVGYGNLSKQVQRYCEDIRPTPLRVEKRIEQKKNKINMKTSPPTQSLDIVNEPNIHQLLPDSKARNLWIKMAGHSNSVSTTQLLRHLRDEFVRLSKVTHRPLSHNDCKYLNLLLCTRFGAQENDVPINVYSHFWNQWFHPFCLTVSSIRDLWEQNEPKLIFGLVTKKDAENSLQNTPSGTFLIRMSDSQRGCFSLMFYDSTSRPSRVRYLLIEPVGNGEFELSAGTNLRKASLADIILSLKKLEKVLTQTGLVDKHSAFEPFAHRITRSSENDPAISEAGQTMTGTSFISEGSTMTEIPKVVIIEGKEGLSGKYHQQSTSEWRGGRPTYKGPIHPQEGEHVCLWFDDQRSEWTLSLDSMVGSTHCLAFLEKDSASDPSKILPFNLWQVALGQNQGWGQEKLVITCPKTSVAKPIAKIN